MLYLVEYVYSGVDKEFNGIHHTRFLANTKEELDEQTKGLKENFEENFPEDIFPKREFQILNIYQKTEPSIDALKKARSDALNGIPVEGIKRSIENFEKEQLNEEAVAMMWQTFKNALDIIEKVTKIENVIMKQEGLQ